MSMEHCWNGTESGNRSYVLRENPVPLPLGGDVDVDHDDCRYCKRHSLFYFRENWAQ